MRIILFTICLLSFFCLVGTSAQATLYEVKFADPYMDFDSNKKLLYTSDKLINTFISTSLANESPLALQTISMGSTMFVTYLSHEMAHMHVGRLFGETSAVFPYFTKEFHYIPTLEQYIQETGAGPNQQELNARYYWSKSIVDSDFNRSFGFLLNKLTSPVYFFFTRNLTYWDRGFRAPYEYYNVFGDHNFYVSLLNKRGIPVTKSQLLSEIVLSNVLSLSTWDHFGYWGTQLLGQPAKYRSTLWNMGDLRVTPPLFSVMLLDDGPYYLGAMQILNSIRPENITPFEVDFGLPAGLFSSSKESMVFIGIRKKLAIDGPLYLTPYFNLNYDRNRDRFAFSKFGVEVSYQITNQFKLDTDLQWNHGDIIETEVKHRAQGFNGSISLGF